MKCLEHLTRFERGVTYFIWTNAALQAVACALVPVPWHIPVGSFALVAFDALINKIGRRP